MSLIVLGAMLLVGLAADVLGRHSPAPRVTLLLLAGLLLGPSVLGIISEAFVASWFSSLTQVALAMVGFLLGQKLTAQALRRKGALLVTLTLGAVLGTAIVITIVLLLLGTDPALAIIMGGIATATAPAATLDVVREVRAHGEFTDTLLSIVALDDAWALIVFSLLLAAAGVLEGAASNDIVLHGLLEIVGALALGLAIGVPMAYLTGRIRGGEPMQAEAFGFVLVGAGVAASFALSPILVTMAMGSTVASLARHHERPFAAIEGIEWPFLILFFILAGASLELGQLGPALWLVAVYILARAAGKLVGVHVAGRLAGYDPRHARWLGVAMMPQAGVAIGLALIAAQRFDHLAEPILAITLASTVILEIGSPMLTRLALRRVGEVPESPD